MAIPALTVTNWAEQIGFYDTSPQVRRSMIYGEPKVGKTTFAATWPSPFFIDTDRGGMSLGGMGIPYLPIHFGEKYAFDIVMDLIRKAEVKAAPFDRIPVQTLVFDSFSTLADDIMYSVMKYPPISIVAKDPLKGKPEWDHYAILQSALKNIVIAVRDAGLNMVLVCGQKLEKDDARGSYVGEPLIVGGYRHVIDHDVDYVFYLTTEAGGSAKPQRYLLYTGKYSYFAAGTRCPKATPLVYKYEDPTYEKIFGGTEK